MKKLLIAAAAAAAFAAVAAPAFAADASQDVKVYGSIGYTALGDSSVTLGGAQARIGFRGTNFGIEAEGTLGVAGDSGIDLDSQYGAYLVGFLPVSDNVDLIGRVGYSHFEVSAGGGSGGASTTNFGIGAQFNMDDNNGFRADYTYMSGNGNGYMAGVSYVHTF